MTINYERDFSNIRFLVVDDKPYIRKTMRSMLLRLRAKHILEAESGHEALEVLVKAGGRVDLILSDWNMGPVSGLELLRTIRTGNSKVTAPTVPFIMLTVHAESERVHSALELDLHGYVVKPVSFHHLVRAIDSALVRKIAVRPAGYYNTIGAANVLSGESEHSVPPVSWVMWMSRLAKRQQFQECLQKIRQEARALNRGRMKPPPRPQNKRESAMTQIPVGTVLAENIYDDNCGLLVEGGTAMTPGLLDRLHQLVVASGQEFKLWIADH